MLRCAQHIFLFKRFAKSIVSPEILQETAICNEPLLQYLPDSKELCELQKAITTIQEQCEVIPIVINGQEYFSKDERYQVAPHCHSQTIAKFFHAEPKKIHKAAAAATAAQVSWDRTPLADRVKIFETAADLMATKYRAQLVAATIMGQAKNIYQAEIDAAAELIDFMRINALYLKYISKYQPISPDPNSVKNHIRFRGIDGFIAAISPFNFTAIGGNLAYAPILMGNAVLWKPADTALLSSWRIFQVMREAGIPDGVANFVPSFGPTFGEVITSSKTLSAINFTGSMPTFTKLWSLVGNNLHEYYNFPRLIGECGGKNFHFVHESADLNVALACTIRSAFEYSGQKCSACSRLYVPESVWKKSFKEMLCEQTSRLIMGNPTKVETFLSAVIDAKSYKRIIGYIQEAKARDTCEIISGGVGNNLNGYFIRPTIIEVHDHDDQLLQNEIFGPVLSVYVYKNKDLQATMDLAASSKYALTAAIFAEDEKFLRQALEKFKMCAGNFYINDKSTGAVVGQQPFGGGRVSGTNDKAGYPYYLLRFTSPQSIKETFASMHEVYYPYMGLP